MTRTAVATANDAERAIAFRKEASAGNPRLDQCPACGEMGAAEWLQAPDRLHGRQQKYLLLRCPACSVVWLSQPPKPSEMHLHYTNAYHQLISAGGENSPQRWRARK
jgi:formate dehydrogenase maturation protein FdhE